MITPRRTFLLGSTAFATLNLLPSRAARAATDASIIGHNNRRYRIAQGWGVLDPAKFPVANCHEIVEDSQGRIILFQTNAKNNVLIYDKSGKLLESWGTEYPGAHGLAIVNENGTDFLFLTDTKGTVYKADLKGNVIFKIERPVESGKYPTDSDPKKQVKYSPTNIMPAPDGTFYIGDGYGSSYILHYDNAGKFIKIFGGKGTEPQSLNTPHGGMVDTTDPANPVLLICSRSDKAVKKLTMDGQHLQTIPVPGLSVCQIRKKGSFYYIPSLEGVVTVLDAQLKIVSNPGGTAPEAGADGQLAVIKQVDLTGAVMPPAPPKPKAGEPTPPAAKRPDSVFLHPHGIWTDDAESVYVAQWNSNNTYPIKLDLVS